MNEGLGLWGVAEAVVLPRVGNSENTARLNYRLAPLPAGEADLGVVFARGDAPEEMEP